MLGIIHQKGVCTTHLQEGSKPNENKTLTMTSAGEETEQRELSNVAAENDKWFGHFGKHSFATSNWVKHVLSIGFRHPSRR